MAKIPESELETIHKTLLKEVYSGWCYKCHRWFPKESFQDFGLYRLPGGKRAQIRARCSHCGSRIDEFYRSATRRLNKLEVVLL